MTAPVPQVTVLVAARNEEHDIERCIAAIGAQDYPLDLLEVLVIDGGSTDGTVARATAALTRFPFKSGRVVSSPAGTTPASLNRGLAEAGGEIVCRVDARSLVQVDHVRICVATLVARPEVAVVGGAQVAVARDADPTAMAIARALNNPYVTGLSRYRRATASGASDTVYLGAFRTEDLRAVGGWDERLTTNQDFDLNRRMAATGTVWFAAELRTGYLPRQTLGELWSQHRRFGRWKVRYWRLTGERPRPRQLLLLAAPAIAGLGALVVARDARQGAGALVVTGAALLVVDAVGAKEPASLGERARAAQASLVISGGWLTGVWSELLRPTRPERHTR